jgi:UDP-N-acetylmuramate: L-alanyl-gamma-D-glutamyl-meso-diaminopimelate ligase
MTNTKKRIHFIAIGGAAMHNLALVLHHKGFIVTGSDDEIAEPSLSRLKNEGLLPAEMGWYPIKITEDIDAVILGMHARADNPELLKAQELGIKIYSYPEYLYEFSKNKKRVVIGGSHGKTTITAMVLHVLKAVGTINFDYMVGAKLEGYDTMVKLTEESDVIILEGDEYLSSPIDRRPKFHLYQADIALMSGIAWDHINVFPTYEEYVKQFQIYADQVPDDGVLIYCSEDKEVERVAENSKSKCKKIAYSIPRHEIKNGVTYLFRKKEGTVNGARVGDGGNQVSLQVFGTHNLLNIEGARMVCRELGIPDEKFYSAIASFKGAARRLELLAENETTAVYKDFAHSPSKLKATTEAVKNQFEGRKIIACMELHTFSSLNENFLSLYAGSMDKADEAIVYYNPHTIEHKKLKPITAEQVMDAFKRKDLKIFTDSVEMKSYLLAKDFRNSVLLMMTSGTFDGINLEEMARLVTA